jgi:hypothetical protein
MWTERQMFAITEEHYKKKVTSQKWHPSDVHQD